MSEEYFNQQDAGEYRSLKIPIIENLREYGTLETQIREIPVCKEEISEEDLEMLSLALEGLKMYLVGGDEKRRKEIQEKLLKYVESKQI